MDELLDSVVIGGGAAGLSAALVLGRARRDILVIDAGKQSNLSAHGVGGLLGHDGLPPAELYARGREEVASYPSVELLAGEAQRAARDGDVFEVHHDGGTARTRTIVLAMGARYVLPEIGGIGEFWGDTVFHCPFCHGWEVRDRRVAVLDDGESGVHMAGLLRGWSSELTLLTNGAPATVEQRELGVAIDERVVTGVRSDAGAFAGIAFKDGEPLECDALNVAAPLVQRSPLAAGLGVEIAAPTGMLREPVATDDMQATNVPGVFAAGDVANGRPQVAAAVAAGAMAAASVVFHLSTR